MKGELLRWGILSAGLISNDFVVALSCLDPTKHEIHAAAARSKSKAEEFAKKHGIKKFYGTYEEIAKDPEIDVVYIGSVHTHHYEQVKMVLEAGKPILCEKPMCLHPNQLKDLFKLAKSKNLFLMEAIWSRYFPAYKAVTDAIERGDIGEPRFLQCFFGEFMSEESKQWDRVNSKELAGGAVMDYGVYPFQLAELIFKEKPVSHHTHGFVSESGVDRMSTVSLKFSNTRMASIGFAHNCRFSNDAIIGGTKGTIQIHFPFWAPTKITINGEDHLFELPKPPRPLNYSNSTGLSYEAEEVYQCLKNGLLESTRLTHNTSITIAEMMYKSRRDLGYEIPVDKEWDD